MKLKHACRFIGGGTPNTSNSAFWSEDKLGTPWVAISDMSAGGTVMETAKSLTTAGLTERRLTIGDPGTVLFAMYASVGAVATLGISAVWNQALLGVVPQGGVADSRFVGYWLRHFASQAVAEANSATQANLNADQVANFPFTDTSADEQRRIADFLDDRVARIERIIAARREQETQARDSRDAEWSRSSMHLIGRRGLVPIRRFLHSIVDGPFGSSLTSSHYTDSGTRVIRLGNIGVGEFKNLDRAFIDDDYAATLRVCDYLMWFGSGVSPLVGLRV